MSSDDDVQPTPMCGNAMRAGRVANVYLKMLTDLFRGEFSAIGAAIFWELHVERILRCPRGRCGPSFVS